MAETQTTRLIPSLPPGLSPAQATRYEEIAAIARATADRLPRGLAKTLEPAHVFVLHGVALR
ncbi:hypothetical protein [Acidisoma cladoniae]|uniref:hypothetical protein n=1 Tax=Acidisoma cladoniae TaxID=3040935 RepID=UPI00254CB8DA|nr:hypothetical protein [Acidisoma sp. PAMC 29798]